MSTLTVIPYTPTPPSHIIRKPSSKHIAPQPSSIKKSVRFDFIDAPIKKLHASSGATSGGNLQRAVARNSKARAEDTQVSCDVAASEQDKLIDPSGSERWYDVEDGCYVDDGVRTQATSTPEKYNSDDDTDDEFPSITRLLSPNYVRTLAKETPLVNIVLEESSNQVLDNLTRSHGSSTPGSHDEPIILDDDNRSEDGDGNLDTEFAPLTFHSGQPNYNAFNLETPPILFNRTVSERDNDHGISNDETTLTAKRQRSVSPDSVVRRASVSPLPHSKDAKRSRDNIDYSDPDEWADDDVQSKRQRLSTLSSKTALERYKNRSQHSSSPTSEEGDGTLSASVDSKPTSTVGTTPAAVEPALPTEPRLVTQLLDANQIWEVRKIIGKEDVDGVLHYRVVWAETLEPEYSLGHAKELLDKFEAQLRAQREAKNKGGPGLKRGEQVVVEAGGSGDQQQKKHRGRPRKQR